MNEEQGRQQGQSLLETEPSSVTEELHGSQQREDCCAVCAPETEQHTGFAQVRMALADLEEQEKCLTLC
jgi:hypothetical protein